MPPILMPARVLAPCVLAALIAALGPPEASAEAARFVAEAGGESASSFSVAGDWELGGTAILRPRFEASFGPAELRFLPRLRFGTEAGAEFSIDTLLLTLRPWGGFAFEVGRFAHLPGTASLLSNLDYFSEFDFERLVEEGVSRARLPDDLVTVRFSRMPWMASALCAPFLPPGRRTPPSSPWLCLGGIESSFTSPLGTMSYELRDVVWADEAEPWLFDPSFLLELGYVSPTIEMVLSYFDGVEREPRISARVRTLSVGDFGRYDLLMRRESYRARRLGLGARLESGTLSAFVDASCFEGRLLSLASPYDALDEWQGTMEARGLAYTVGFVWRLPLHGSTLSAEWRNSWYLDDVSMANAPFLERAAAARLEVPLFGGLVTLGSLALYSLEDGSWALFPSTALRIDPDARLTLALLFFSGGATTELGRFAASNRARIAFEHSF